MVKNKLRNNKKNPQKPLFRLERMGNLASLLNDHTLGDQIASGGPGNIWFVHQLFEDAWREQFFLIF
jgi:hypothetical protein